LTRTKQREGLTKQARFSVLRKVNVQKTIGLALATTCLAGTLAAGALAGGKPKNEPVHPATPVVLRAANGFAWDDAAIGAAAGFGAALAAAGAITLARNR
jgi:hypothetical protein